MVNGYNTDKKILNLKLEELIKIKTFTRSDLEMTIGLKKSLADKSLITFLSGLEERKINYVKEQGK